MENATPMLRQYLEIKKSYPGTILFFRLGDFYEMFNEDAIVGARELEITLTARQKDSPNPLPMCGVPHHAAAGYIAKLVKKGYRVAICEQAEAAGKGVKLVKREVVRVITPGTAIDSQLTNSRDSNYLAAISGSGDRFGIAFLELSTGSFQATEFVGANAWHCIVEQIESFSPREILRPSILAPKLNDVYPTQNDQPLLTDSPRARPGSTGPTTTEVEDLSAKEAGEILSSHFKTHDLAGFGFEGHNEAARAAGFCLAYAQQTQKASAEHISEISYYDSSEFMVLDAVTLRNLDLVDARSDNNKHTLLNVIDETTTSMGGRLLRSWLVRPSIKRSEIQTRQSAVMELSDSILRDQLRFLMKEVSDIERLVGRVNLGNANPRDLLALLRSIRQVPKVAGHLVDSRSLLLQVLSENMFDLPELADLIDRAIADEPPMNLADCGVIKDGFDKDLDDLRQVSRSGKQTIASFEESERQRSGIPTLKVRFNNVFGYYIEISKAQLARVPEDYERRQTLANAERYTTPQLKEWEQKVLGAEEKIVQLETELFERVRQSAKAETQPLQSTARAIGTLDALASLAETAAKRNYVCPTLHDGDEIEIKNGRHPVVEAFIGASFVPNDSYLNNSTDRLMIVTGANMGGKSTVLRQIALIQVLAQIGSFVPAASARLPIVDRVWTRVGASDDLASGRSTFMVEMTETAAILHNATARSLILLDEIGRGTSTFDGLSIAWAVAEYLHNSADHAAKTLFATHYHELTELAEHLPGAKNYQITASETDGDVVFLHKLAKGKASKSYGIAVAKLAGLPAGVVERAKEVLEKLEKYELAVFADEGRKGLAMAAGKNMASQFSLFAISNESAIDELRSVEIESLSPEDSKNLLRSLKSKIV
ncbi:MAG: DNA mismatch repair protein MutS [bacterium]|nr:DNA mismatch repair protein MutS [bacterium]